MEALTGSGPSRRDFLVLGAGVFAVSALGLSLGDRRLVRRSAPVMGTIADLGVVARNERAAHRALDAAFAELNSVQQVMSRFDPASDIGRINRAAVGVPVPVTAATAFVVRAALRWAAVDGSRFDPALGRAVELWDVTRRVTPPADGAVRRLAGRRLYQHVIASGNTVTRTHPDVALDLGGIAKGYAVDRAVAALQQWGTTDAVVNVGGDLAVLGRSADGDVWQVGIRSPHRDGAIIETFALDAGAIATSGDYEQYFTHDGRRYHHLLDPVTAAPRDSRFHSLTIRAASCMDADAAATALFGCTPAEARSAAARSGIAIEVVNA